MCDISVDVWKALKSPATMRCSAIPCSHDRSSPTSVFRNDDESGWRWVDVTLIVRPFTSIATLTAERSPLSNLDPVACIGNRDRIMHPMPFVDPDSVWNL